MINRIAHTTTDSGPRRTRPNFGRDKIAYHPVECLHHFYVHSIYFWNTFEWSNVFRLRRRLRSSTQKPISHEYAFIVIIRFLFCFYDSIRYVIPSCNCLSVGRVLFHCRAAAFFHRSVPRRLAFIVVRRQRAGTAMTSVLRCRRSFYCVRKRNKHTHTQLFPSFSFLLAQLSIRVIFARVIRSCVA